MFAVLHVSDFSLQAVLRLERELAGRAVALLDDRLRPPVVVACTREAAQAGVEPGQTAPQAMARCATIQLRTPQPAAEEEAKAGLWAAAFSVSPQVEATAPGVCTLQVGGLAGDRREPALAEALGQLERLGLCATAGLAATPLLALYAARAAERCRCIVPGAEAEFLRDLPLATAEPSAPVAAILAGWGVQTLGDLTALAKADVVQRLGPEGMALWERAAGETTRPLKLIAPPDTFAAELELEHEVETLEPLLFVLRRFIDRLALELRNAGQAAGALTLGLMLSDETCYAREFRLPEPTTKEDVLFRVLHTHLETLHTAATICGVRLECRPARPLERQQGLFESELRDPHGFAETLARVSAVVGPQRVGTPVAEDSHRPDAISLAEPPAVVPAGRSGTGAGWRGPPLRRYRPPRPATVELEGAAPVYVWTPAVAGSVNTRRGPWRGSGEWWDAGRRWQRVEWDVELEGGGVYRLLRTTQRWFLEGEYD